jgi:uncharacterized protein (TIGR02722 family)
MSDSNFKSKEGKMKKLLVLAVLVVVSFGFISCAGTTLKRVEADTVIDLSGKWNDVDAQLVTEKMVEGMLTKPWLTKFAAKKGREPRVIVGEMRNKTEEHIDTEMITKAMENELINSGSVEFVATKAEREEIREERADMQEYSSEDTRKEFQKEIAADFMLKGVITFVGDQKGGTKVSYYQINMELINTETNLKVWAESKPIKKVQQKSGIGF